MLTIEKTVTMSPEQWEIVIEGMRNPKNSWDRMDSFVCMDNDDIECPGSCPYNNGDLSSCPVYDDDMYILGPNDHGLMMNLADGGPVHAKYRRMIPVWVTINAPLYWWKEFDTYKVGTVANSCSTMHKIHAKEFEFEDFSTEYLYALDEFTCSPVDALCETIKVLNTYRNEFLKTKDKNCWWQMIQLLPSSYNQKRTVMLNYEVLVNIYEYRKNHKLDEWHTFCDWIETLPYSELITGLNDKLVVDFDDRKKEEK